MTVFDAVLTEAVLERGLGRLLSGGRPPSIKVDGLVSPVAGADSLDAERMRGILERLLPVRERAAFAEVGEANLRTCTPSSAASA